MVGAQTLIKKVDNTGFELSHLILHDEPRDGHVEDGDRLVEPCGLAVVLIKIKVVRLFSIMGMTLFTNFIPR